MAMSHDVNLPIGSAPRFPDLCVCCLATTPGMTLRYSTNAIGWWTLVLTIFGKRHTIAVPICPTCRKAETRNRRVRYLVDTICVILGCVAAFAVLKGYHGAFKFHLTVAIALVAILPLIAMRTMRPPPFDMTAFSSSIDYEFKDAVRLGIRQAEPGWGERGSWGVRMTPSARGPERAMPVDASRSHGSPAGSQDH